MMQGFRRLLVVTTVALLAGGCAASTGAEGPVVGDDNGTTTLVVENQSTSDMRIYAVASGQRIRIGSVTGLRTERLRIPNTLVGNGRDISFIADPLAGAASASSFEIYIAPGEEVQMVIPPSVR